jgi:hypothetical protein
MPGVDLVILVTQNFHLIERTYYLQILLYLRPHKQSDL